MKQRAGGSREGASSRDAAGEQRREQMLRAAQDVIVERGYADTRIADVAERTGTSPALVIYYFKTRDQLLTEAIGTPRTPGTPSSCCGWIQSRPRPGG